MPREMKDSGIEWIGEIPAEWKIIRFKFLHNGMNTGESIDKEYWSDDEKDTVFYTAGLLPIYTSYQDFPEWKYTNGNDLLLARNGTPYVYYPVINACYTDHIIRAEMKADINRKFVKYGLQQSISSVIVNQVSIATWSASLWNEQTIPWAPLSEQQKISAHLDIECAKIDDVISKSKATIEEYKKLKQSVITEAVTKGIRPNREMKDSGSVWFNDIPSDWNCQKLKFVFHIQKDIAGEEGYTVLSITQKGIIPKDLSKNEGQLAQNYSNYQFVHIGDFAMNHMDLLTGWVDISKYEGVTSPDYRVFVLNNAENNSKNYYLYMMQMCYSNKIFYGLGQGVSGFGRWRLQADKFLNFYIPIPPYEEQQEIADYLDKKCYEIDTLIAKKEQIVTELESYKKSLIYEYVTGKKEVV